jgi:hypothetical protein
MALNFIFKQTGLKLRKRRASQRRNLNPKDFVVTMEVKNDRTFQLNERQKTDKISFLKYLPNFCIVNKEYKKVKL